MEDVIQTYLLPYNPAYPQVCFDEACKQMFGEVQLPLPPRPGSPAKQDCVNRCGAGGTLR